MFTLEQINDLHARLGKASTLLDYVRALHAIGVKRYDSYVMDGHSDYFGDHGYTVSTPAVHAVLSIAETSNRDGFLRHLKWHEQGRTSYFEMSRGLAESGIEKWTVDTGKATMAYFDVAQNALLNEQLE